MDEFLLLESGDFLLQENGDRILLETGTSTPEYASDGHTVVVGPHNRFGTVFPTDESGWRH